MDVLVRLEFEARLRTVGISDFSGGEIGFLTVGVGEVSAVESRMIEDRDAVEEEFVAVVEVVLNAVFVNDVNLLDEPSVDDGEFLTVDSREGDAVLDEVSRRVVVIGGAGDRFAQGGGAVGRINDVLIGRNDGTRKFQNGEGRVVDVVIGANVTFFFAPFVNGTDAFDVESDGDRVVTRGERSKVGNEAMFGTDANPIFLIEPIKVLAGFREGNGGLRLFVNDVSILVDALEGDVVLEVVDDDGVADIRDVEVNADVRTGEEVVELDCLAVDGNFSLPVIDRFFDDSEVGSDDGLEFEGAHIDRANHAVDDDTDATIGAVEIGRGVAIKRVRTGVNRDGTGGETSFGVKFRIDAQKRAIVRVELIEDVADLSDIGEERRAEGRRRASRGEEVVTVSFGFVIRQDGVVDRRDARVVETGAVLSDVAMNRDVDEAGRTGGIDRAALAVRNVLSQIRVGKIEIARGVDRAAVASRNVLNQVGVSDRRFTVGVENRAVEGLVAFRRHGANLNGSVGVNDAAVSGRGVVLRVEVAENFEGTDFERTAVAVEGLVLGNGRVSANQEEAAGGNRAAFRRRVARNRRVAAESHVLTGDDRAVFVRREGSLTGDHDVVIRADARRRIVGDIRVAADLDGTARDDCAVVAGQGRVAADLNRTARYGAVRGVAADERVIAHDDRADGVESVSVFSGGIADQFQRTNGDAHSEVSGAGRALGDVVEKLQRAADHRFSGNVERGDVIRFISFKDRVAGHIETTVDVNRAVRTGSDVLTRDNIAVDPNGRIGVERGAVSGRVVFEDNGGRFALLRFEDERRTVLGVDRAAFSFRSIASKGRADDLNVSGVVDRAARRRRGVLEGRAENRRVGTSGDIDRAADVLRGSVIEGRADNRRVGSRSDVDRAAVVRRLDVLEARFSDVCGTAVQVDRAAVVGVGSLEGYVLDGKLAVRVVDRTEVRGVADEARVDRRTVQNVDGARDNGVPFVIDQSAFFGEVVLEGGVEDAQRSLRRVVDQVALRHDVVGKGYVLDGESAVVLEDRTVLRGVSADELEVLNGRVPRFGDQEEAGIV